MKYLSLFSGIGGFELGIQKAYELQQLGIKSTDRPNTSGATPQHTERPLCIGYSEIDKYAIDIYQKHFPEHKNYGDITKIKAEDLPEFDLIVGGFPCQSFSIAGKRGGFNDTRGTMFFEIARILRAKQPRLLLLENVKGLLSHDEGRTFATIIATLDELGYDLQWQVLNSKNFGVPQNRERVFIVGHLRGTSRPEVFPFSGADIETITPNGIIPVITPDRINKRQNGRRFKEDGDVAFTLTSQDRHGILQINNPKHSNDRVYDADGISPTLNTMQGGNRQPFVAEDMKIRRLTPTECERLQGFPDGWTQSVSDTQRYKCLGNAVTVNVIEDIISKIINS